MQENASPPTEAPLPVVTEEKVIVETAPAEEATTEPEEQPEPEADEGTPEEAPRPSFNSEDYAEDPDYKALIEDKERKAHTQGQIRETGRRKETQALVAQVMGGVNSLNKTLTDAAKDGNLNADFADIIRENAPVLQAYGQLLNEHVVTNMREQNRSLAIAETIAEIATQTDNIDMAKPYFERLIQPSGRTDAQGNPVFAPADEFSIDGGKEALTDYIKDLVKSVDKKGFERGVRSRDGTTTELDKGKGRKGKGPAEVKGAGGGTGTYASLSAEERKAHRDAGTVDTYITKHG